MGTPTPPDRSDPLTALRGRRVVLGVTGGIAAYKRPSCAGASLTPART
jgi:hypothetical protein